LGNFVIGSSIREPSMTTGLRKIVLGLKIEITHLPNYTIAKLPGGADGFWQRQIC
jgi:hypothetical protein